MTTFTVQSIADDGTCTCQDFDDFGKAMDILITLWQFDAEIYQEGYFDGPVLSMPKLSDMFQIPIK